MYTRDEKTSALYEGQFKKLKSLSGLQAK